jgi:hypothetical protein
MNKEPDPESVNLSEDGDMRGKHFGWFKVEDLMLVSRPSDPDLGSEDPEGDDDESVSTLFTEYFESDCYDNDQEDE